MIKEDDCMYTGPKQIVIDDDFFEHLLNCLANQKFIRELKSEDEKENQKIIDAAWNKGMEILTEYKKNS